MIIKYEVDVNNEKFMNLDLKDTDLNQRAINALKRGRFMTMGDLVNAVNAEKDFIEGSDSENKIIIRNLGKKTAHEIMEGIYSTYIGLLDDKHCEKAMNRFAELNADVIAKHPEFGLITCDVNLFRKYWAA